MAPRRTVNNEFDELYFSEEDSSPRKRGQKSKAFLRKKSNYPTNDYEPYDDYDEDDDYDYDWDNDDWDVSYNPPYK